MVAAAVITVGSAIDYIAVVRVGAARAGAERTAAPVEAPETAVAPRLAQRTVRSAP